jgi:hypothetical protein
MRKRFFLLFFGIYFLQANAQTTAAPAHLKYFGFFLVDTEVDDPTDGLPISNYLTEVDSFSNLAQMAVYFPTQDLQARINFMNTRCVKPFLSVQDIFFYRLDDNGPSGNHYVLYADYLTRWNAFKAVNASVLNATKLGCFYVSDEPFWNGISFAELNAACQLIKNDFPTIPLLLIEASPTLNDLIVPQSIDWLGFDHYARFHPLTDPVILSELALLKSKRSAPHQRIFLVADDQWVPLYYDQLGVTADSMRFTIQEYYDLAASDTSVAGLLGYLWPSGFQNPAALGARGMPQSVKNVNIQIGKKIKANYTPCNITLALDTNHFYTTDRTETKNKQLSIAPNPTSGNTKLSYTLAKNSFVRITIFDCFGRMVLHVLNENQIAGKYTSIINTSSFVNGTFLVHMQANQNKEVQKLIIQQ